jgi:hypothetical protein
MDIFTVFTPGAFWQNNLYALRLEVALKAAFDLF